jgi:hypothetical protein
MGWRQNVQEMIRAVKSMHKEKVKSLALKHMEKITTETDRFKSQHYKQEQSHTKQIVAMQEKTKRNHELVQFFCVILFLLVCSLIFKSYSFL